MKNNKLMRVKNCLRDLAFFIIAMATAIGCSSNDSDIYGDSGVGESQPQNLCVAPLAPTSKVSFEDIPETGIKLGWEKDDILSVYKAGTKVSDFKCTEIDTDGKATFEATKSGVTLDEDTDYVAVYPACSEASLTDRDIETGLARQNQVGDTPNHLDNGCFMRCEFKPTENLIFEHEVAVMVVVYNWIEGDKPTKVDVTLGEASYSINVEDATPYTTTADEVKYRLYFQIMPDAEYYRELTYTVTGTTEPSHSYSFNSSMEYNAGVCYRSEVHIPGMDPFTPIEVGDFISADFKYSAEKPANAIGMVYKVIKDGKEAYAVYKSQSNQFKWVADGTTVYPSTDTTNGMANMSTIYTANGDSFEGYNMVKYCYEQNSDKESIDYSTNPQNVWYLPSEQELKDLFNTTFIDQTTYDGKSFNDHFEQCASSGRFILETYVSSTTTEAGKPIKVTYSAENSEIASSEIGVGASSKFRAIMHFVPSQE